LVYREGPCLRSTREDFEEARELYVLALPRNLIGSCGVPVSAFFLAGDRSLADFDRHWMYFGHVAVSSHRRLLFSFFGSQPASGLFACATNQRMLTGIFLQLREEASFR
jgi:hypothetical protein